MPRRRTVGRRGEDGRDRKRAITSIGSFAKLGNDRSVLILTLGIAACDELREPLRQGHGRPRRCGSAARVRAFVVRCGCICPPFLMAFRCQERTPLGSPEAASAEPVIAAALRARHWLCLRKAAFRHEDPAASGGGFKVALVARPDGTGGML